MQIWIDRSSRCKFKINASEFRGNFREASQETILVLCNFAIVFAPENTPMYAKAEEKYTEPGGSHVLKDTLRASIRAGRNKFVPQTMVSPF